MNDSQNPASFQRRAEEIEAEKERKKQERLEKKRLKELKKKRQRQEKLVAPIMLILTVVISLIIYLLS